MKFTPSLKNKITEDWHSEFPSLSVYDPLRLMRRIGPLLFGLVLDRVSGNDAYRPALYTHNLLIPLDFISLGLWTPLRTQRTGSTDTIRLTGHADRYQVAAKQLRERALLPLNGPATLNEVVAAYDRHYSSSDFIGVPHHFYEKIVSLLAWGRCSSDAQLRLNDGCRNLASRELSPTVLDQMGGGIDAWRDKCQHWIDTPKILDENLSNEIVRHRVENIAYSKLLAMGK